MKTRALLLALPLLALGCRDQNSSLQIQAICMPTDDCTFSDTCDAQYIGFPSVDTTLSATGELWLLLQLENQVLDNGDDDVGRTNTNDAHVDETVVEFDGIPIPRQIRGVNYYVPASGSAVVSVLAIPPGYASVLQLYDGGTTLGQHITARIKLRGYWDHGGRFETAEFPVGVNVCQGCNAAYDCGALATCPPQTNGQLPIVCMDPEGAPTT